ncbi:GNAT family N-acetyltransferase [Palleronia sp. LCG004]|uniref:GNAT family N-acetyltransferase n=1 Tax=Palleronia sp. LCG004 TaxID=3079304 RepID=UPI00294327A1|nr:GNAT family N-acetyltransferase [Palleronia sp. LCG004]WOI56929.1 GNAT family N-acetyltransferase [Palleronia sp. LCG004]
MAAIHARAMTLPRPWSASEIESLLAGRGAFSVTVAEGFALGRVIAGEAELLTIAIAPEAQGHGRGRDCLARFHVAAEAAGATEVFLEVAENNAAARALYAGAGYSEIGRRRGYYRPGEGPAVDALILRHEFAG